jgi:hypothetical protein
MASQRLLSDFRARKQLHHENILALLGFTHDFGPLPAMVSPWIHNGSLTTYLEHHFTELTIEQKLRIVSCFSEALLQVFIATLVAPSRCSYQLPYVESSIVCENKE